MYGIRYFLFSCSSQLEHFTGHDLWAWLSAAGAIIGLSLAISGGLIGIRAYISTNRFSSTNQMHEIFREYLKKKNDIKSTDLSRFDKHSELLAEKKRLQDELAGFLLYTLEEMFAWTQRERRDLKRFGSAFLLGESVLQRGDMITAWEATIVTHLLQEREYAKKSLLEYSSCYSSKFLTFVARYIPEIGELARCSDFRVRNHLDRPIGTEERSERTKANVAGQMPPAHALLPCCATYIASLPVRNGLQIQHPGTASHRHSHP